MSIIPEEALMCAAIQDWSREDRFALVIFSHELLKEKLSHISTDQVLVTLDEWIANAKTKAPGSDGDLNAYAAFALRYVSNAAYLLGMASVNSVPSFLADIGQYISDKNKDLAQVCGKSIDDGARV